MLAEQYGSVVIPAHNEERVIGRCLDALTASGGVAGEPRLFEIVVVCNGCTDETARVAREYPGVMVVEVPEPSKVTALNVGDDAATAFPRIYLDADSELSNDGAWNLLRMAAGHSEPIIVSAAVEFDQSACSPLARSYSRCAKRTSFGEFSIIGRGVYVLNEAGRSRFGRFPELMGDDYFVASLFTASEQIIAPYATVVVRPPSDIRSLTRVRSRIYYGNWEAGLERSHHVSPHQGWRNFAYAVRRTHSVKEVLDLVVYALVTSISKLKAAKVARSQRPALWGRDDNSRRSMRPAEREVRPLTWAALRRRRIGKRVVDCRINLEFPRPCAEKCRERGG